MASVKWRSAGVVTHPITIEGIWEIRDGADQLVKSCGGKVEEYKLEEPESEDQPEVVYRLVLPVGTIPYERNGRETAYVLPGAEVVILIEHVLRATT